MHPKSQVMKLLRSRMDVTRGFSIASLVLGALIYILSVYGLFWPATNFLDIGLVGTTVVLLGAGAAGLWISNLPARAE